MDASSRSLGRFGRGRCAGPPAFRPIRVRAHPAAPRGLAEEVTAGWGNPSAGEAEPRTGCVRLVGVDSETGTMLLREKLEANPGMPLLFLTIRSVGYCLATAEG